MVLYIKISFISIFSLFLGFRHDFIRCVDFTHIAASNTASDDVTNSVTRRIFNTDLIYYCVQKPAIMAIIAGFNAI